MHTGSRVVCFIAVLSCGLGTVHLAGSAPKRQKAPESAPSKFELSVDSIMRGPKLVGYPPTGLRWSGDST